METQHTPGFVVWLTGMNRAGKSTLAAHLATRLAGGRPPRRAARRGRDGGAAARGARQPRRTIGRGPWRGSASWPRR